MILAATRAGLPPGALGALDDEDVTLLLAWHISVAGDDRGRAWWPLAVRKLPLESRLRLARDADAADHWEARERARATESPDYFVRFYGSVQPEVGPPVPFNLWPEQRNALTAFHNERRVIVLKTRQIGMTWLALHYALWLMALNPLTPNAKILALSKVGEDARKLLARTRAVNGRLPAYLRRVEDRETRESRTNLRLRGRGEMISLTSSPEAARMETATLAILDEFAHVRNRMAEDTWTAVLPTLGREGKAIVVFTGNGPAEAPGDGQAAARLWERSRSGESDLVPIFLASAVHPDRTAEWRERKRREFLTEEAFAQEYPETEQDALAGKASGKVYPPAGVNAAEALGRELDGMLESGDLAPPAGDALLLGWDWGEHTHGLVLWPLEGGGVYVAGETVGGGMVGKTVRHGTRDLMTEVARLQQTARDAGYVQNGRPWPPVEEALYDAAGVESMRTFRELVESDAGLLDSFASRQVGPRSRVRTRAVPFNRFKQFTLDYLRNLFERTADGETTGVIAISHACPTLLRQLRGLEFMDDESGRVEKGDDHGPDALIAGTALLAARARGIAGPKEKA